MKEESIANIKKAFNSAVALIMTESILNIKKDSKESSVNDIMDMAVGRCYMMISEAIGNFSEHASKMLDGKSGVVDTVAGMTGEDASEVERIRKDIEGGIKTKKP